MKRKHQVGVLIDFRDWIELGKRAKQNHRSRAAEVRIAIKNHITEAANETAQQSIS